MNCDTFKGIPFTELGLFAVNLPTLLMLTRTFHVGWSQQLKVKQSRLLDLDFQVLLEHKPLLVLNANSYLMLIELIKILAFVYFLLTALKAASRKYFPSM